jgi:hypothetical protein
MNAGGNISIDRLEAGDYATTAGEAAEIRSARGLPIDAPLTSLSSVVISAGGWIRESGIGDSGVDVVANRLQLSASRRNQRTGDCCQHACLSCLRERGNYSGRP